MKLNKILSGIGAVVCTSLLGAELSISPATAQSQRPYIVFVNGWQNCCAWGIADRLLSSIDAQPQYVPYSNFVDRGRSGNTSTDEQFLRDGADFINNQLDRNRPLILIGHSFGGDSVLKLLPRINRRIQFVAVIDPVTTGGFRNPITRSLAVGSNVDYFFNRWQENVMFPNDFKTNGTIPCRASRCDQEAQNIARNADFSPVTTECRWDEVTCPEFVAPNPLIGRQGRKGRKQARTGHQDLPKDAYIQRILGERISQTLATFRPPESPPISSVGQSQIVGLSNKCIGVRNGNSESGTPLTLWECNGNADQRWSLTSQGSLQGLAGKCIGVRNGNSESGTPLTLWECNGNADQKWSLTSQGSLQGLAGKCIGVQNGNSEGGTPLILWECNGNADQRWSIQ